VLKGIAITEALIGAGNASGSAGLGGQTFDNDPESDRYGFYVDLGTNKMVGAASASSQGAARADSLVNALGMGYKDYEPSFAYLIANPAMLASLRSANLIDADRVQDGNIELETLFQGKFRLIKSRANQSLTPTEMSVINGGGGVDIAGTKISFLILPGSVAHKSLTLEAPVGIDENAGSYHGFGHKDLWYRWGYVAHPAGYSWAGSDEAFPANAVWRHRCDWRRYPYVSSYLAMNKVVVFGRFASKCALRYYINRRCVHFRYHPTAIYIDCDNICNVSIYS
jgi:hypothetical protein